VSQPAWVKATASSAINACVEMALDQGAILVRHSGDSGPILRFTPLEFAAWLHGAKAGEFDHLLDNSGIRICDLRTDQPIRPSENDSHMDAAAS